MTEQPKPCPFCGGADTHLTYDHAGTPAATVAFVSCCGCGALRPDSEDTGRPGDETWNRRVTVTSGPAPGSSYREILGWVTGEAKRLGDEELVRLLERDREGT